MNAMTKALGSAALALVLCGGLAAPAWADKISQGGKNPPIGTATPETTTPDTPTVAPTTGDIDFGDDTSEWANDGECDDPRFSGEGSADEVVDADILKDATDCQAAYDAGTVTFLGETPATGEDPEEDTPTVNTTPTAEGEDIDFGDDTSEWANDGECDDPRFSGEGSAEELVDADIARDATDCQAAYDAGTVTYVGDTGPAVPEDDPETTPPATDEPASADIDFGDDSGEWANDGECDDPRFTGEGLADEVVDADIAKDATDCRAAYEAGTVTLAGEGDIPADTTDATDDTETAPVASTDYGDDTSEWANDGECDDPRFTGEGVADELVDADIGHDATDCQAAVEAGTATWADGDQGSAETPVQPATPVAFDYGADWSRWANDGECDDLRFEGEGTNKKLLSEDTMGDATDCQALEAEGKVAIRTVYTPEYAAGAPYDSSDIEWGDNTSSYADDDQCDDPRFEGPGTATTLLDSDLEHDAEDCKAAFENGTIVLREDA
jgi:hypothetical protein